MSLEAFREHKPNSVQCPNTQQKETQLDNNKDP
jgi:hypothetical protein